MKRIKQIVHYDESAPDKMHRVMEFVLHEDGTVTGRAIDPRYADRVNDPIWTAKTGEVTMAAGQVFFDALEARFQRSYVGVITVDEKPKIPK